MSNYCEDAPRPYTSIQKIKQVIEAIKKARKPLIIIGKGAAYSHAENEVRQLVENLKIPFLPTPMGNILMMILI